MDIRRVDPAGSVGCEATLRQLQLTVGRMEHVLAAVPSGLVWIDGAGLINWCNESFATMAQKERLFTLGRPVAEILPLRRDGAELGGPEHPFVLALKEQRGLDEVCEAGPPGWERVLRLSGQFAKHAEGEAFLSVTAHDITAEVAAGRELEARTRELKEALGEHEAFTYSVAHDLRAPLRTINSFVQILEADFAGQIAAPGRNLLARILKAGMRMDRLITDLLAYSRLRSEDIELETVELEAVVERVVASLADEIKELGAEVRIMRPIPAAIGHAGMLSQAISNLIRNAAKFTAPGTKAVVVIRGEVREGRTRLWVEDNGIGIEPRFHEKIFSVFQRLHSTDQYAGTGIGLAIVRRAAARSGGATGVESEPGAGSRFWIDLPGGG